MYEGKVIGAVNGFEVRRLNDAEAAEAGRYLYKIVGLTGWEDLHSLARIAEDHVNRALVIRDACDFAAATAPK
jgi:hypothetical protein